MKLKIYATDLAAYNAGFLIGKWLELGIDEDELNQQIREILEEGAAACQESMHEEIFITDYEFDSDVKFIEVNEYSCITKLNEQCIELESFDEDDIKKVAYLIDNVGFDFDDAIRRYEEVTIHENTTLSEIAEEYISTVCDLSEVPDIIKNNIDFESIGREFDISGEYEDIDGDIYHFVNC